jgi:hypothetical protein
VGLFLFSGAFMLFHVCGLQSVPHPVTAIRF